MTDIEKKALALLNECGLGGAYLKRTKNPLYQALCRAIEQHEAFRQEVSDLVANYVGYVPPDGPCHPIVGLIIAKPDPLVEVMNEMGFGWSKTASEEFLTAIEKRGGKIVWEND
jgi:hypothetical protein